jgi:hypothetical protein
MRTSKSQKELEIHLSWKYRVGKENYGNNK